MTNIKVQGLNGLENKIKKIKNPERFFDDVVYNVANDARDEIQDNTPTYTFFTRRSWTELKKKNDSLYEIVNDAQSKDKKHSIINIIRFGRPDVYPKIKPLLFIPLNAKTADKARKNIYNNIKFGKDYVMAKKSKAVQPNDFITPIEEKYSKKLTKEITKKTMELF